MQSKDPKKYYSTLNVSLNASDQEIKESYRKLARELHPDKNMAPDAKEKFQALAEAYCGILISSFRSR